LLHQGRCSISSALFLLSDGVSVSELIFETAALQKDAKISSKTAAQNFSWLSQLILQNPKKTL
jgi:hypothetical protein